MIGTKINDNVMQVLKSAYNESRVQELLARKCVYLEWQDKNLQRRIVALEKAIRKLKADGIDINYRYALWKKLNKLWQIRENQRPTWDGVRRIHTEVER